MAGDRDTGADRRAGCPAEPSMLVNVPRLMTAYYTRVPDLSVPAQRVAFGTSGHRGSALAGAFNEAHILAIGQAVCDYRKERGIGGPLFLGIDTHALSEAAFASTLEVMAANGVDVMIDDRDGYTPTPVISHAILSWNRGRAQGLADGVVITPSHNPPEDGGFKYNPPHGGPADTAVTAWIQDRANALLAAGLAGVRRMPFERARWAPTTHRHDYLGAYIGDLAQVIDMDVLRAARLDLGVDPLGGAGVHYWGPIADRYALPLTVISDRVDPTFGFMTLDWDGRIRMDCSSSYAMQRLIGEKERFDVAWACDTDHDRHGIVTRGAGLLNPNHYLAAAISYLFTHRPEWRPDAAIGKTVVSSSSIDRVATRLGRRLVEVPVGFKWFVDGLLGGALGFAGEESAGASLLRRDGSTWTTDKDGIVMGLLAAEMTAVTGRDPGEIYASLAQTLGDPVYRRIDAAATAEEKAVLAKLQREDVGASDLAGEPITEVLCAAPGNAAPIGGLKVTTRSGWFAARPSGTESVYKLYAESFAGEDHLQRIIDDAQAMIRRVLARKSGRA
ncbi:MAG: phosphoglucomutase (alpha-D-glucose-1,6-bisphosphate-dependent) [Candidatus Levyibacteriota bacterium]